MIKRLAVFAMVVIGVLGLTGLAVGGDYHVGTLLVCSDCHVMHGQHASVNDATTTGNPLLLKGATVNQTCLTCHEGTPGVPDVLGNPTDAVTNGRLAGALNVDEADAHGYANDPGYGMGDGHTLWSKDVPPGFMAHTNVAAVANVVSADGLECSDCHSVHGAMTYRNMRYSTSATSAWAGRGVLYSVGGSPDNTKDVYEAVSRGYNWDNVHYMERDVNSSPYGYWCMNCHYQFHGSPTDASGNVTANYIRHPTAGVNVSVTTTGTRKSQYPYQTHRVKLMDATGTWAATTANQTPSCFSCHKSHGNKNDSGLIWFIDATMDPTVKGDVGVPDPNWHPSSSGITEEGDYWTDGSQVNHGGTYRDLCRQCHGMGSWPQGNPLNIGTP